MIKNHGCVTNVGGIRKHTRTTYHPSPQMLSCSRNPKCILTASKQQNDDEPILDNESDPIQEEQGPLARVGKFGSKLLSSRRGNEPEGPTLASEKDGTMDSDDGKQVSWIRRIINQRRDSKDTSMIKNNESDDIGTEKDAKRFGIFNRKERQNEDKNKIPSPMDPKIEPTSKLAALNEREGNVSSSLIELEDILMALDDSLLFVKKQLDDLGLNQNAAYLWYDSSNDTFLSAEQDEERLKTLKRDLEQRRKEIILLIQRRKKELEPAQLEKAERIREAKLQQRNETQERKKSKEEKLPSPKKKAAPSSIKQPPLFKELKEEQGSNANKKNVEKGVISGIISSAVDSVVNTAQSGISYAMETARLKKIDNKGKKEEEWMTVCPKTRISPGEVYPVVAGGLDLLVIGSRDGTKVYCVANSCPHLGTPLESGMIQSRPISASSASATSNSLSTDDDTKESKAGFEDCIVCPLHRTEFSLDTGEVRGEWCPYPPVLGNIMGNMKAKNKLPTFKMRTRGKNIEIMIVSKIDDDGDYIEGPVKTNE